MFILEPIWSMHGQFVIIISFYCYNNQSSLVCISTYFAGAGAKLVMSGLILHCEGRLCILCLNTSFPFNFFQEKTHQQFNQNNKNKKEEASDHHFMERSTIKQVLLQLGHPTPSASAHGQTPPSP